MITYLYIYRYDSNPLDTGLPKTDETLMKPKSLKFNDIIEL